MSVGRNSCVWLFSMIFTVRLFGFRVFGLLCGCVAMKPISQWYTIDVLYYVVCTVVSANDTARWSML